MLYNNVYPVFPLAIAFNHRMASIPGRDAEVLVASALVPFRLTDGQLVKPNDWYAAVTYFGGEDVAPDSLNPLCNSEVVFIGSLPPVKGPKRDVKIQCGSLARSLTLYPDPAAEGAPVVPGPRSAVWHKEDNPWGRGGPDDSRKPLIVKQSAPLDPVWMNPTPFVHPARMRLAGIPEEGQGPTWASNAQETLLNDAHSFFWVESLHPGEPIVLEGLGDEPVDTRIPPYRVAIASYWYGGEQNLELARIHSLMLIPAAQLGAVIWRVPISVGTLSLPTEVEYLLAGMEDMNDKPKDVEQWYEVLYARFFEPGYAVDDRPLLPRSYAAAMPAPWAFLKEAGEEFDKRSTEIQEWLHDETGVPTVDENPFANKMGDIKDLDEARDQFQQKNIGEVDENEGPTRMGDMESSVSSILAKKNERRRKAGVEDPDPDPTAPREPVVRGDNLEREAVDRLEGPFRSPQERLLIRHAGAHKHRPGAMEPEEVLVKVARARIQAPDPVPTWPAFNEPEALAFGEFVVARLNEDRPVERYVDVQGAMITSEARFSGIMLDSLLAEETTWEQAEFHGVKFYDCSLTKSFFKSCLFTDCEFIKGDISHVEFKDCRFERCKFQDLNPYEMRCANTLFQECEFERFLTQEAILADVRFAHCRMHQCDWLEPMFIETHFTDGEIEQFTLSDGLLMDCSFERMQLRKFWGAAGGMPNVKFEDVQATTSCFVSSFRLDHAKFVRTQFHRIGFINTIFRRVYIAPGCLFEECDLTGCMFVEAEASGTAFPRCGMLSSIWLNSRAVRTSFFSARLLGAIFHGTELFHAIFVDADLNGVIMQPEKTIGADFTGANMGANASKAA